VTPPGRAPGSELRVGVAVPAAGSGSRMGGVRKPLLELAGVPILVHALRPFLVLDSVVDVVVALAPEQTAAAPIWLTELDPRVRVVAGGGCRSESVSLALAAISPEVDVIAVHDAARPLVTAEVVAACVEVAAAGKGAVAGCPAVDTLKEVDARGRIVRTPDRERYWRAHTPQVFPAAMLREAYASGASATDDAALIERLGGEVVMVDGGAWNVKVTRPEDVPVAEAILIARAGA